MAGERISDEVLAEGIDLAACGDGGDCWVWWQEHSAKALAELQALRAALTECVPALAAAADALRGSEDWGCHACGGSWVYGADRVHEADCPAQDAERVMLLARAALEGALCTSAEKETG